MCLRPTEYILTKLDRLSKGYVFTYKDFLTDDNNKDAVIKALNRMVASEKIAKLSKGKFYKVNKSVFGDLKPNEYQILKDLVGSNGKPTGYLTAFNMFNRLGLTTQVSNTFQIGKNEFRSAFKRGYLKISIVKQKNTITKKNIPLLQILDAIRYIKKIPDTPTEIVCGRFVAIIKGLSESELKLLIFLAKKYSPATRAFLGAFLDEAGYSNMTNILKSTLNPATNYKLSGSKTVLKTAKKWNIL